MRIRPWLLFSLLLLATVSLQSKTLTNTNIRTLLLSTNIASSTNTNRMVKPAKYSSLVIEHADNVDYFKVAGLGEEIVRIKGRVIVTYKSMRLKANRIAINLQTRKVYGSGNIFFIQNGQTIVGEGFFYDMATEKGVVYKGASVLNNILYSGDEIKTIDKNFYKIEKGYFSTCAYHEPHYSLEARKIWIYPDNSFFILHLTYIVGGVKLFYFPFAFRTMKGTGIKTYAGYSSDNGYFIQNTFNTGLFNQLIDSSFKLDYYQFKGLYAGTSFKNSTKWSHSDISLNGAQDRRFAGGAYTSSNFRHFISINQDFTPRQSKDGSTSIQMYFFEASDNLFAYDYMANRVTSGGIALNNLALAGTKTYDYTYFSQNSWYINLTDTRGPSSLGLQTRWNLLWNNSRQKFIITSMDLPALNWSISGRIDPFSIKSNSSSGTKVAGFFLNSFSWRVNASLDNQLINNADTGEYQKLQLSDNISTSLNKDLNFFNVFIFTPGMMFGYTGWTGMNLTDAEKSNFALQSYPYFSYTENWRLNIHSLFRAPGMLNYFNVSRSIQYALIPNLSEYGRLKSHVISAAYQFSIRNFSYSLSTSANLRAKTNERPSLLDPAIYNNLSQYVSLSLGGFAELRDTFAWSIHDQSPVRNTFTLSLRTQPFSLAWMKISSLYSDTTFDYNYYNPLQSYLGFTFGLSFEPFKYTTMNISTYSRNSRLYKYSAELLKRYGYEPSQLRGVFEDLVNSFNFFDYSKRSSSEFKIQSVSVTLTHNLHCWELSAGYSLSQAYTYVPYYYNLLYPYWEHRFWIQINIVEFKSIQYRQEQKTPTPVVQ
jgi:hypothetical protein